MIDGDPNSECSPSRLHVLSTVCEAPEKKKGRGRGGRERTDWGRGVTKERSFSNLVGFCLTCFVSRADRKEGGREGRKRGEGRDARRKGAPY